MRPLVVFALWSCLTICISAVEDATVDHLYRGAVVLLDADNPQAAAVLLERARAAGPASIAVLHASAVCASRLGDDEAAADHYRAVLELAAGREEGGEPLPPAARKRVAAARQALAGDAAEDPVPLAGTKLPVPAAAARRRARATLEETYGERLDDPVGAAGRELVAELIAQAENPANAGDLRYEILRLACEIAVELVDAPAAWTAVRALVETYAVEEEDLPAEVLDDGYRHARTPEEYRGVARTGLEIAGWAMADEAYDLADDAARRAAQAARRARAALLYRRAEKLSDQVRAAHRRFRLAEQAGRTLADAPDDAQANLTLGGYRCFVRGEWAEGLPHLAKGADPELAAVARSDMAATGSFLGGPAGPAQRVAVADAWLELARDEREGGLECEAMAGRALRFYRTALPELRGVQRAKVVERIDESRRLGTGEGSVVSLRGCVVAFGCGRDDVYRDGGETRLRNRVGNGHDGVLEGVDFGEGAAGEGLVFAGEGGVTVPNAPQLQVTGDLTVAFWLRPSVLGARRNPCYKSYGGELAVTIETDGGVNYYFGTSGRDAHPYQGFLMDEALVPGEWVHLALVRDLEERELRWYRDGELVASTGANYAEAVASTADLRIGGGYAGPYLGVLDEFYLFARALDAEELARLSTR